MGEETDIAEPVASDDVVPAEDVPADEPSKEQRRKRKKHLYKSLRDLMEFYLGDVNLGKDRFMNQRIKGQPFVYVDLSTFLTFNKVRALTSSVEDLAKALAHSEILQVSEDGTQVCRKTPIRKKENEEQCTIYVEQLGPDVDHELLSKVFSEYGPVDYVSIPRFSHNGKFKGFAFVEFKDPESAKNALEAFNAKGCCLSPHMAPEELLSIKNFDPNKENKKCDNKESADLEKKDVSASEDNEGPDKNISESETTKSESNIKSGEKKENLNKDKRKRKYSDEFDKKNKDAKKLKTTSESDKERNCSQKEETDEPIQETEIKADSETNIDKQNKGRKNRKRKSTDVPSTTEKSDVDEMQVKVEQCEENMQTRKNLVDESESAKSEKDKPEISEKQKRKHSAEEVETATAEIEAPKPAKKKKKHSVDGIENAKSDEETLEPVKKKLKSDNEDGSEAEVSLTEGNGEEDETGKQKKKRRKKKKPKKEKLSAISLGLKVLPKKEWRQLRNKYLNMQRDMMRNLKQQLSYSKCEKNKPSPSEQEEKPKPMDKVKSGTVIKVTLDEPVTNAKTAKNEMRVHPEVRYVDVSEGSPCVYLRTSTPEVATALVDTKHWATMEVIQGDEETEYFKKMEMDREMHFKKNKPNQRGRTKLLKRAERFQGKTMTTFEA